MPFGVVRPLHLPILPPPPGRGRQRRSSFPMRQGNAAMRDQAAPTGASTILGISRASDLCARTRMPVRHEVPGGIGMTLLIPAGHARLVTGGLGGLIG